MSGGTNTEQYIDPTNDSYFAFSIQELFTISTADTSISSEEDE